ncbi:MAG: ABC transporter permease [Acidimicrobiia bacterium]|nr:ABC transporter permease [Acidimicrobiia bacterium]
MTGRRAALKVATRNARRNRRRTIFLILLVAVPVGFGVVVAGIVRAGSLTPEESAQSYFGSADARVYEQTPVPGVRDWVLRTLGEQSTEVAITEIRGASLRLPGVGFTWLSDLDLAEPVTKGLLVLLAGDTPHSDGEVAISPTLAGALGVEVGDRVEFGDLPFGELEVVGLVSRPFSSESSDILIRPGGLLAVGDSAEVRVESSLLLSGPGAEDAAGQLQALWYDEGQRLFWPEPAVDPKPAEIEFLDDQTYLMLTESEILELVDLVDETGAAGGDSVTAVYQLVAEMTYGTGRLSGVPDLFVDTRSQWLATGSLIDDPGVVSTGASAVVLVEVAFITGAAFAAGTRRRLREIGLMGANGASEKQVRTAVLGEALTIGSLGATLGVLLGIGVLVLGRPLLQRFVSRVMVGVGVSVTDVVGPVVVALVSVLLAVWIPARTASKVPITTALQGRMPVLAPRKWIVPVGAGCSALGVLLISVSLASESWLANGLVGVGAAFLVGGVALTASPILALVSKMADRVPAASRLVLRDSGRNRTRSAVAVAAVMVILLAPIIAMVVATTTAKKDLVYGLPSPSNHLVLAGSSTSDAFNRYPITGTDVAAVVAIVAERAVAVFDTLDLRVATNEMILIQAKASEQGESVFVVNFVDGNAVAVGTEDLLLALDDPGITTSIGAGEIVVLGIEDKPTKVSLNSREYPAHEYPVAITQWTMPRVLIPQSMVSRFSDAASRPMALLVLERPPTNDEYDQMSALGLVVSGGSNGISEGAIYLIAGAASLLVVLIVVALVTAVSAAEVDEELRTIVAVGAPGAFRRRFLGLLTGYQTLVAMLLAVPLGLGLVWVFSSAQNFVYAGPFGLVQASAVTVPWPPIALFATVLPIIIGVLTLISVRSAPVTPPRRAT